MTPIERLKTDRRCRSCSVDDLPFDHTGELTPIEGILGQDRAITALRFGVEIARDSNHLFALGPSGLGKHDMVQRLLAERASQGKRRLIGATSIISTNPIGRKRSRCP